MIIFCVTAEYSVSIQIHIGQSLPIMSLRTGTKPKLDAIIAGLIYFPALSSSYTRGVVLVNSIGIKCRCRQLTLGLSSLSIFDHSE